MDRIKPVKLYSQIFNVIVQNHKFLVRMKTAQTCPNFGLDNNSITNNISSLSSNQINPDTLG